MNKQKFRAESAEKGPSKNALKKQAKEEEKARKKAERDAKLAEEAKAREAASAASVRVHGMHPYVSLIITYTRFVFTKDFAKQYYGKLPLNMSQERTNSPRAQISSLSQRIGETVVIRARVQTVRATAIAFLVLRQKIDTVQAVVATEEGKISKQMVKWTGSIPEESIVLVEGVVNRPKDEIQTTTVRDAEIVVRQVGATFRVFTW